MPQSLTIKGETALVRQANAPQWKFGDRITATDIYQASYATCLAGCPRKGALGTGEFAGLIVEEATVTPERGKATLTIVYSGLLADETQVPADEVEISQVEQQVPLARHPKFSGLPRETLDAIEAYLSLRSGETSNFGWLFFDEAEPDGTGTLSAVRTKALIEKRELGIETFMISLPRVTLTTHHIEEPTCDPGSYPEDPIIPVATPLGLEWLRMADTLVWNGTYWKRTSTWQSAHVVDSDLYPVEP